MDDQLQVDLILPNAVVYNIKKIDVVKGTTFSLRTDLKEPKKWFSDNDKVLSIDENGIDGNIDATELGQSIILILEPKGFTVILKQIEINVVASIADRAVDLNLKAGQPVPKLP